MMAEKCRSTQIGEETYQLTSDDDYLEGLGPVFEPHMVKLFNSLISKTDHVLDVGANIGCTSILFGQLAQAVCSFEPSPSTVQFLRQNIAASGLNNVEIKNYALGRESGESEITFAPNNRAGAFLSDVTKASIGHVTEPITVKTLDAAVTETNWDKVDFIKIDAEGYEQSVIDGGRETVARFRPMVVLELNDWCLQLHRICVLDFFDYLRSTFPILLAINQANYLDLHDGGDSYRALYRHVVHSEYSNIVAAFNPDRLFRFYELYRHA
ncbi:MAG: FkbM family methyltransferase [Verrucomicrobiota bacterium]|nr:FkbM family methyltransferase [Verrucomicrobiota bacterium]